MLYNSGCLHWEDIVMDAIIWGAGRGLKRVEETKGINKFNIRAIVDSDKEKWGKVKKFCGKELRIISPSEIKNYDVGYVILSLLNRSAQFEIVHQLSQMKTKTEILMLSMEMDELIPFPKIKGEYERGKNKAVIFSDVSEIAVRDSKSGIQRVVNNIHANNTNLVPVQWIKGYFTALNYDYYVKGGEYDSTEYFVTPNIGEKMIMIDAVFDETIVEKISYLKKRKVKIYVVVYDLIPVRYRELCFDENLYPLFKIWINAVLKYADCILCISDAVAVDVKDYYKECRISRDYPLQIYTFPMGYDIKKIQSNPLNVREEIKEFVNKRKTFLMVGTVEIRKNQYLALKAWINMIEKGYENNLLIIGKDGWKNQDFKELYYDTIKEYDSILWIGDASDDEVAWSYQNATALLYPTKAEGYGLPLIEAANFGLPVLCSDIPVFREVAKEAATYFKVDDVQSLIESVVNFNNTNIHPDSKQIKLHSWKECAQEVDNILNDKVAPKYVLE